jgi:transposase
MPGNHESAGMKKSVRTNRGDLWLKMTLSQCAWAATNRKGSKLQTRYHALRVRCGNKRAIVALAHTLLTIIHAVLKTRSPYREAPLTEETEQQEQRARYHLRCLKKLGYPMLAD